MRIVSKVRSVERMVNSFSFLNPGYCFAGLLKENAIVTVSLTRGAFDLSVAETFAFTTHLDTLDSD